MVTELWTLWPLALALFVSAVAIGVLSLEGYRRWRPRSIASELGPSPLLLVAADRPHPTAAKWQRTRKLTPEEKEYAWHLPAASFLREHHATADWWVVEMCWDDGETWEIIQAFPVTFPVATE